MTVFPYTEIERIAFELSNRCVHALTHLRCPAHQKLTEPTQNLKAKTFSHVISTIKLGRPNYDGYIYFHLYNEPMADPRLINFVMRARSAFPKARIQITTSGWNLDQTLLDELEEAGTSWVRVSTYSMGMLNFLRGLDPKRIHLEISKPKAMKQFRSAPDHDAWKHVLRTDIPNVYEADPVHAGKRCHQPYRELCITHRGEVALCCMDWKRTVIFGDLNKEGASLHEILTSVRMMQTFYDLRTKKRHNPVCLRCSHVD